ncbi:hypothetical protein CYMTET_12170 [Cymbomonas tetramitiformis]|uniref:EF-hand domain-containing protein n=1 Tax=Cymbomonas tetramitiformis TaxID=36881 RepID=A0AAE0LCQ3_9CHLO|nr:hypothetical protein CYMTET_12170 [Cymbomonas tetramitiformis]
MLAVAGLSFVRLYMVQVSAAKFVGEDSGFFHATASTISTDCPAGCDLMSHVARLSQAIPAFAHIDNNKDGNISFHEYAGVLEAFQELLNQTINQSTREGVYVVPPSLKDELERRSMFHGGRRRVMSEDDSAGSELEANSTSTNSGVTYINSTELGQEQLSEALGNENVHTIILQANLSLEPPLDFPSVNRTLSLEGDCGDLSCLVDGGHGGPLVTINQDGNVTISKLSLKHFSNSDGGVVVADSGTIIAIADCNITDCVAEHGGVVYGSDDNVIVITDSVVSGNRAEEYGGVVFVNSNNVIVITNTVVDANVVDKHGGVVYGSDDNVIVITDSVVSGNRAEEDAGGFLLAAYNVLTITNCDVSENSAAEDGGVMFVEEHNAITFTACNVTWNAAEDGGVVKGEVDNNITFIDSGVCYNHVLEARLCQFNCPTLPNCTILRCPISLMLGL